MNKHLASYIAVSCTVLILWIAFLYLPYLSERTELETAVAQKQVQLDEMKKTVLELPEFIARHRIMIDSRQKLHSSLYAKQDIMRLIDHIREDADKYGLTITEIAPPVSELLLLNRHVDSLKLPDFLNITLMINGSYSDFGKFVGEIEHEPFFRDINTCRVNGAASNSTQVMYSFGFKALLGQINIHENEGAES